MADSKFGIVRCARMKDLRKYGRKLLSQIVRDFRFIPLSWKMRRRSISLTAGSLLRFALSKSPRRPQNDRRNTLL
ncbi:MAG: hypothetical protein ACE5NG_07130 [bacterium]